MGPNCQPAGMQSDAAALLFASDGHGQPIGHPGGGVVELHQASHLMVARNCRCPSPCEAVTRGSHSENLEALIGEGRLRTDAGSLDLPDSEYGSSVRPRRKCDHPRKVG